MNGMKLSPNHIGTFHFTIVIGGDGKTVEEAWKDACEASGIDESFGLPEEKNIELVDEREE